MANLHDVTVELDEQLANVRRWNDERDWGFTETDFNAIDLTPAKHAGLVFDVVAVFLPDQGQISGIQRTFDELWDVDSSVQPGKRYESVKSGPEHLRLLDGINHKPGIRRVTLDCGANWDPESGIRLIDVRGSDSVHAEALAAAAHFPKWIRAMDGESVPYVWMPGYQMRIPGNTAWCHAPDLIWSSTRGVELRAGWDGNRSFSWACPVVVRGES